MHGFLRVAAAIPLLKVADTEYNSDAIISMINEAQERQAELLVFPELSITAYTCGDLFHQNVLIDDAQKQLERILKSTMNNNVISAVGVPVRHEGKLYNCGVVIQNGRILGVVPKSFIPGYKEFYEQRWFSSGKSIKNADVRLCDFDVPFGTDIIFECSTKREISFGVEICEDLWAPIPPSSYHSLAGAVIILNLSASNDLTGKSMYRQSLVEQQSARCMAGYVYASSGMGESTTDIVYGGHGIIAENGIIIGESERFRQVSQLKICDIDVDRLLNDRMKNTSFTRSDIPYTSRKVKFDMSKSASYKTFERKVDAHPFVPFNKLSRDIRCEEVFSIQTAGLIKRLLHTGFKYVHIGISGGLDSTLALLAATKAFDSMGIPRANINAVTMPGFGTTEETLANALELIRAMKATSHEIDIKDACLMHFANIKHNPEIHDTTYENVQARERTQILMNLANKHNSMVIGTGDLSEMALGWSTYNGDHMSMYSVNCSIPKTLVKYLVEWVADNVYDESASVVLKKIINTPITPELLPPSENDHILQKTEEIIGPYELHDFFLYHMIRYGAPPSKILFLASHAFDDKYTQKEIAKWLQIFLCRFFTQQFKRSCVPDGPKVGSISLSPRGDWRMPSDACYSTWLKELNDYLSLNGGE